MQQQNPSVEAQYRALTLIWAGLLFSQILFLGMIYFVKPEVYRFDSAKPLLPENAAVVILALAFLGITTFALSFALKNVLLKKLVEAQNAALVQTALVLACALCEATTLFGLILAFAFDYQYFFLWFALGILGFILHFPRRDWLVAASYKRS